MASTETDRWLRQGLMAVVVVHLVVTLWHGLAHTKIPVPLSGRQTAFVWIVIFLAPLAGFVLLWKARRQAAAWTITVSMFASLLFGVANHYMLHSPDHVSEVPEHSWRHAFVLSAALVAATEAIGSALGAVAAFRWRKAATNERVHG